MGLDIGDRNSTLFTGLSGFWQRFFRDTQDLEAFYQASEIYLGQVYLDLLGAVLNVGLIDTPVFNKEYWKLFLVDETQVNFIEGPSVAEDRYIYDMPANEVSVEFLQNSIFDPDILFERGVDFDVEDNDGYVRFNTDPFKGVLDSTGDWTPRPGIGWRTIQKEVGNQFTDQQRYVNWIADSDVLRGDILRLLGYAGALVQSGNTASITTGVNTLFSDVTLTETLVKEGDLIIVSGASGVDDIFNGIYVVGEYNALNTVSLDGTFYRPTVSSSTPLTWKHYRGIYFDKPRDYEVDYFDKIQIVGSVVNPYPLDVKSPIIYTVVRNPHDASVLGDPILAYGANPEHRTDLSFRHVVRGSLEVYARVLSTGLEAVEGVDYTVDYLRGRLYQLNEFNSASVMTCSYRYQREIFYSAGGLIAAKDVGRVKQLSLWAPETLVDRYTLYNNYGYMLNRFEASSESYKSFLRGIIHLYVSGPVLERIEAALNVAAGYPVVRTDGEVLLGYDSGIAHSAADGTIASATRYFTSSSYTFSSFDVGGTVVFPNPSIDFNRGHYRILSVVAPDTVELETAYGFIDEGPTLEWVLTYTYQKRVTTNLNTYIYPYNVLLRGDVMSPANIGTLSFKAFESLTTAFIVTDYIEDPRWWHDKYIPSILWDENLNRRYATTKLFEHVIGPTDDLRIGDPGFFIGADDEGHVFTPNDNSTSPGVGNSVSLYRHSAAFILFDRYLKCHMFYVKIAPDLELSAAFSRDLEDLILVAKPSYTYPYVEPGDEFVELATLYDDFSIPEIGWHWSDDLMLADNNLKIGDTDFPWSGGGYFRYLDLNDTIVGTAGVISPATPFLLPVAAYAPPPGLVLEQRLVDAKLQATVGGLAVIEGRDYRIQWLADEPDAWWVYPLTTWDLLGADLVVDLLLVEYANTADTPVPDTTIGFTPLAIGGLNPAFVRRGALDPNDPLIATQWNAVRTHYVDRALSLHIDVGGLPYTYP